MCFFACLLIFFQAYFSYLFPLPLPSSTPIHRLHLLFLVQHKHIEFIFFLGVLNVVGGFQNILAMLFHRVKSIHDPLVNMWLCLIQIFFPLHQSLYWCLPIHSLKYIIFWDVGGQDSFDKAPHQKLLHVREVWEKLCLIISQFITHLSRVHGIECRYDDTLVSNYDAFPIFENHKQCVYLHNHFSYLPKPSPAFPPNLYSKINTSCNIPTLVPQSRLALNPTYCTHICIRDMQAPRFEKHRGITRCIQAKR